MVEEKPNQSEPTVSPAQPPVVPQTQEQAVTQAEEMLEEGKPNLLKRFWYLFLIFGVLIILSLGILVYGYQKLSQEKPASIPTPMPTPTPIEETDEQTSALENQGTSDEITDIEDDLEATNLSDLDQELEDIDSELSSP